MAGGLTPDRGPETLGGQYVELGAIPYKLPAPNGCVSATVLLILEIVRWEPLGSST
jgi:hypothetical protein